LLAPFTTLCTARAVIVDSVLHRKGDDGEHR
jgi:hypothetical protein